jgi:hypothetical protein
MWIAGEKYVRSIQSQEAYCGQNSRRLIMSTGSYISIDSLIIKWPIKVGNVPFHKQVIPGSQIVMQAVNAITEPVICHTVLSPLNDGLGSLRAAVACAQSGDTIVLSLNPADTIELSDNPIVISKSLVILSPSTTKRIVKAPGAMPAFIISAGKQVTFKTMEIEGSDVLIENHGYLILLAADLRKTSATPSPPVMNYGHATVRGFVSIKE